MAVSSEVSRNDYVGNGSTATFTFTFQVTSKTDLLVIRKDAGNVESNLVLDTDFTAVVNSNLVGGTVTLTSGNLPTGFALSIKRKMPLTTDLSIQNQHDYYPNVIQAAVDRMVMIDQQQQDGLDRSIKLANTQSPVNFNPVLPPLTEANRMIMVNSSGTGFAVGPTPQELSDAAAAVSGSLASADAAAASATAAAASATTATTQATSASNHQLTAQRWASQAAGTVIDATSGADSGLFSARKYAADAGASATAAGTQAGNAATSAAAAAQSAADAASAAGGGVTSLTGDVAGVGPGAATTTIQPGVVTMAKLATAVQTAITGKSPQLNDTGAGASIVADAATGKVKKLVAGTNITITPGADGVTIDSTASAGVVDHGALTGLADDDHTQYHNDARGDARYFTQSQVTTALAAKSATLNDTGTGESIIAAAATGKLKKLIAGSNVTLTAGADGLTIASTGGGGGGAPDVSTATGTLAVANGGTGATSAAAGLANLLPAQTGQAGKALVTDGTSATWTTVSGGGPADLTTATGVLAISKGGTGQATAADALTALLPAQAAHEGKVLQSNGTSASWSIKHDGPYNYYGATGAFRNNVNSAMLSTVTISSGNPSGAPSAGAASLTKALNTTTPLLGAGSLRIAAASAWAAGQGFAMPTVTLQPAHLGKVLSFSFFYTAASGSTNLGWGGTSASQTLAVFIYDVTAGAWVQPAGYMSMNQALGVGRATGSFQASSVASQQYALYVVALNASAGAVAVDFDTMSLGPQSTSLGQAVYGAEVQTLATSGQSAGVPIKFANTLFDLGGIASAANGTFTANQPGIWVVSLAGLFSTSGTSDLQVFVNGVSRIPRTMTIVQNGTRVAFSIPILLKANDVVTIVPAVNFTAGDTPVTASMIQQPGGGFGNSDSQVISFGGNKTSAQSASTTADLSFTATKDRAGAWNGTQFIVPFPGDYVVAGQITAAASTTAWIFVNGVKVPQGEWATSYTGTAVSGGAVLLMDLKANDAISLRPGNSVTVNSGQLSIYKLNGAGSAGGLNDVGRATYALATAQAVAGDATIKYDTKIIDTHGTYNAATGLWSCPFGGIAKVTVIALKTTTGLNGVYVASSGAKKGYILTLPTNNHAACGSITFPVQAGAAIGIYTDSAAHTYGAPLSGNYVNQVTFEVTPY